MTAPPEISQRIDGLRVTRPGVDLQISEWLRAPYEVAAFLPSLPLLTMGRRGDGHHVLVLPGLLADDSSTSALRLAMAARGLVPHAWGAGPNLGPTTRIVDTVSAKIEQFYESSGQPVSLVGWSLGGILAREFARRHPERVRNVVTLGSPFHLRVGDRELSNAGQIYEALSPLHTSELADPPHEAERPAFPCPTTSIYSKSDGVVPWQACLNNGAPHSEDIEVNASHLGLGFNPHVLSIVLDRLTQRADEWAPYRSRAAGAAA